jgi:hypothetical protein
MDEPLNSGTDLLDPSRELIADHVGRFDPCPTRVGTVTRIDRIHSGRPDSNDNAPRPCRRPRELRQLKTLRRSRLTNDHRAHVAAETISRERRE